ncbi:DUF4238 domain-containing protein [Streptococcus mutans]|uniref:DUF4238 domain-containing protein n=1 Tax=Streptococcus mutans TaxID=1309 RepID=UPI0002B5AD6D|nr:DUF4238 domain-containing protein [Streptococcus mutans]EMB75878.1 hypothetical protein SMU40_00476 [Streptococcus mutans 15VF2]EMB88061.1 hypothetical protein SMU57_08383 [Streptococcus mutans NMT4863]EMC46633.1 hypothetical protein SMU99_02320 [Streptococcus mutans 24]EMP64328.1 hypothetical protein D818_03437 [Streptococcus mutans KK23]MCB5062550.1 DUF4238 domain-containing protein [Streptococcus mutans]
MVTKKQHYYPRTLLKHFANNDNKLYVYNHKANKEQYVHYEKICYQKYTYEEKDTKGQWKTDNILEKKLSHYEGKISKVISKILNTEIDKISISDEEIKIVWAYMFLQEIRTNSGRVRIITNFESNFSKPRKSPIELNEIENNKEKIQKFNKIFKEKNNLEDLLKYFKRPDSMHFHIAIGYGFITSDNPVIATFGPQNKPNGFQIILPISPNFCLEFQTEDINSSNNLFVQMTPDKIQYVKKATINTANYYIISKSKFDITQQCYIYNRFNNKNWKMPYPHSNN